MRGAGGTRGERRVSPSPPPGLGAFLPSRRVLSKREKAKKIINNVALGLPARPPGELPFFLPGKSPRHCVLGKGEWISTGLAWLCLFLPSQKQSAIAYFSKRGLGAAAVSFLSFNFPPCAAGQLCRGRGTFPRAGELLWQGPPLGKGWGRTS